MNERRRGIQIVCEHGHMQQLYTPDYEHEQARQLAGLLDGTSEFYAYPPRQFFLEGSQLGRCQACASWVTCTLFGYDDTPPEPRHG